MKADLRNRIERFLQRMPSRAYKSKELAKLIGVSKTGDEYQTFKRTLREMQLDAVVERYDGRKWRLAVVTQRLSGLLEVRSRGWGIVRSDEDQEREIFIDRLHLHTALDGDRVEVDVFAHAKGSREEGEIAAIIERGKRTFVGTVKRIGRALYVEPEGGRLQRDIFLPQPSMRVHDGEKVVVEIVQWDDEHANPQGKVTEVLGRGGGASLDFEVLIRRFGFSKTFPKAVVEEVKRIPAKLPKSEMERRLDLRDMLCFTIDPEDAKDFDDAVSLEVGEDGQFQLGVHIADVSAFVKRGSATDAEALARGTSVYLVDGVIPMLPEKLSSELCSLQAGQDRLTVSVFMRISPRGVIGDVRVQESIIRSKHRFTYSEAEAILDTGNGIHAATLGKMSELATLLHRKRMRNGSIDFDIPEVKIITNENGEPLDIVAKPRLKSMRMIEEFMLITNVEVARLLTIQHDERNPVPAIFRVHDFPDGEKVKELVGFLHAAGVPHVLDPSDPKSFQKMLQAVSKLPESAVINDLTLRAMAKAAYSIDNIGHFGLGFPRYTHFTSPIRRYPDLIVHRLLKRRQKLDAIQDEYSRSELHRVASLSSRAERIAVDAERESVRLKEIAFLSTRTGESFEAVVSSVVSWGLYVELIPTLIEGLIHIRSLDDDYYEIDTLRKTLTGRKSRRKYSIGDRITVSIARVDRVNNQIDFVIGKSDG